MPSVTLPGAMIRAMLAAYRRTLRKTMDQARSMDQVVAEAGLPWLETPDQVVVWGTALGLHAEIETVLERSLEDEREGRVAAGSAWMPGLVRQTASGSGAGFADFAGAGGGSGGLFSSSAVPNIGGMMAALGTIGNSPSSSGSGGGGGGSAAADRAAAEADRAEGSRPALPSGAEPGRPTAQAIPASAAARRSTSSGPLWRALETRISRRGASGDSAAGTGQEPIGTSIR